jgi:hypothetical protein
LIAKTGLGLAVAKAMEDLDLERDKPKIKAMLLSVFTMKFEAFKRAHTNRFQPQTLRSTYLVENEYPVGENDIHQYFKCLAYEVKIGSGSLTVGTDEDRKPFSVIEGFSRNEDHKKRPLSRSKSLGYGWSRAGSSHTPSLASRDTDFAWRSDPSQKRKYN